MAAQNRLKASSKDAPEALETMTLITGDALDAVMAIRRLADDLEADAKYLREEAGRIEASLETSSR